MFIALPDNLFVPAALNILMLCCLSSPQELSYCDTPFFPAHWHMRNTWFISILRPLYISQAGSVRGARQQHLTPRKSSLTTITNS